MPLILSSASVNLYKYLYKYVTEKSHKKIVNDVKSILASIVGSEQFTGP